MKARETIHAIQIMCMKKKSITHIIALHRDTQKNSFDIKMSSLKSVANDGTNSRTGTIVTSAQYFVLHIRNTESLCVKYRM